VNGLLFPIDKPGCFSEAMARVMNDQAFADRLARQARGDYEQYYNAPMQRNRFQAFLDAVISPPSAEKERRA